MPSREQQLLDQIAAVARKAGLNEDGVRVLLAIIKTEGGLGGAVGDNGQSFGPLQFHRKGQLPNYAKARGLSVNQAADKARTDPLDAVEWAVSAYLGQTIREGQRQGLSGAELATYAQRNGQRSVSPERAGQNYAAVSVPQGGTTMPNPTTPTSPTGTNDQAPWEGSGEYQAYKQMYTKEIEAALKAMRDERDKFLDQYKTLGPDDYANQQLLQQRIGALDSLIKQTEAALARAGSQAVDKWLAAQQQRLKDEIEKGKLTQAQADSAFNKVMEQAALGIEGLISGYASLRAALPQMGTQSMADAAKQMLYNWRELGVNIPDFDLPVMQFDPLDEIRKRLPPATDWKAAMMGQQGGGGMDSGMGGKGAPSPAAPPSYSTPPGYMAGPGMPESMQPEAWRQGLMGKAGPTPPPFGIGGGNFPKMDQAATPPQAGPTALPPIRMGGGQPQGTGGALGVPPASGGPPTPTPTQPPLGQGGRPGYTRGAPPVGPMPSPSPTPMGPTPGPTMGPAGDPQQQLQEWVKRNPYASADERAAALKAILSGQTPQ